MKTSSLILMQIFVPIISAHLDNSWTWTCEEGLGKCKRIFRQHGANDNKIIHNIQFTSLKICRLTCGDFGALWPQPTLKSVMSKQIIEFHPSAVRYSISNKDVEVSEFLLEMTKLFQNYIVTECGDKCDGKSRSTVAVYLTAIKNSTELKWKTDESYHLRITTTGDTVLVGINARTVFGIRHGLETLSQLIASYHTYNQDHVLQGSLVVVSEAEIQDTPMYTHRGLLLDTSRNYLPIAAIKRQIDGMAASKLNVLHWHATDSQSFPLVSTRVPQLSRYGAYSQKEVYTPTEVRHLLSYAKLRGIRIILEIDSPSHAGFGWQWGKTEGLGDLALCVNQHPWRLYCIQPPCGQLNPINNNLYKVLGDLYNDIIDIFPMGEQFHMGGDEVFIPCWNSSQDIVEYLEKHGRNRSTESFLWLWGRFQERALRAFDDRNPNEGTNVIVWSSALTEPENIEKYLSNTRYAIQTWVPSTSDLPFKLLEKGYKLIVSTKDAWYLDHGFWSTTTYHDWRKVYKNEIPRHQNVLGGEVCMWGELVDEHSVDQKVWPRAAAAAERLWSDPNGNTASAEARFYRHRERLVGRGIQADSVTPRWCLQNEGECS